MTKNKAIRTALRRLGIERGAIPIFLPMLIQLKKYLPLLGGLLCLPTAGFAQFPSRFVRAEEPGNLAISVGGGIANYRGDLNEGRAFRPGEIGLAAAIGLYYRLSDHLTGWGEVQLLRLSGSQRNTADASNNLSFRSTNPQLTAGLLLELLPASSRPVVNPYLAVGAGLTYLSPQARYQDEWVSLPRLKTEGEPYRRLAAFVYGGIGLSVRVSRQVLVSVELTYTLPSSDYLDDVSTVYPYASSLATTLAVRLADRSPELGLPSHAPGTPRGNRPGTDTYLTGLFRVVLPLSSSKERQYRQSVNCVR